VVAALAIIAIVIFAISGGGGSTSGPKAAVQTFMKAAKAQDAQTALTVVCPAFANSIGLDPSQTGSTGGEDGIDSYTVQDAQISGNTAVVPVVVTSASQSDTVTFEVDKQSSGKWLICNANDGAAGSGGSSGGGSGGIGSGGGGSGGGSGGGVPAAPSPTA
jgi:uncharacterized membrane protein YgcG